MQYIFIHGLGQSSSSWDKTISSLSQPNHIVSLDLWAMLNGKEITYANLYRSFVEYCEGIQEKLNLCGISLGAIIALNYAIEHPDRVQSIALIAAQHTMPKGLLKFQNVLFRLMPGSSFARMGMQKKDVISLTNSMIELDFSMKLKTVSCSALIVCGGKDNANKKAATDLVQGIPNAEIDLLENIGHKVNTEAPEKLAAILNVFWQNESDY